MRGSADEILKRIQDAQDAISRLKPEPLWQMMADAGASPADGWILCLPDRQDYRDSLHCVPDYVKFSRAILFPVFLNPSKMNEVNPYDQPSRRLASEF